VRRARSRTTELEPAGDSPAQVFKSSVGGGGESVRLMYLLSIASATTSIRLQAAYFVPDELAIDTFVSARKRGVKIEIIVPGPDIDGVQEPVRRRKAIGLVGGHVSQAIMKALVVLK